MDVSRICLLVGFGCGLGWISPPNCEMVPEIGREIASSSGRVETNAYQQALADHLKKTSMLPIREVKTVKDKVTRISAGFVVFENGKVLLPENHPQLESFIDEYVHFPHGKHDDILDSLQIASRPRVRPRLVFVKTPALYRDPFSAIH